MPTTAEEYESMFAINAAACFFIQKAGIRMHDRGKIITILTSLPAAFTGCTPPCWQQSVGGTLRAAPRSTTWQQDRWIRRSSCPLSERRAGTRHAKALPIAEAGMLPMRFQLASRVPLLGHYEACPSVPASGWSVCYPFLAHHAVPLVALCQKSRDTVGEPSNKFLLTQVDVLKGTIGSSPFACGYRRCSGDEPRRCQEDDVGWASRAGPVTGACAAGAKMPLLEVSGACPCVRPGQSRGRATLRRAALSGAPAALPPPPSRAAQ